MNKESFRALSEKEIIILKQNGNRCSDFETIRVSKDFNCEALFNNTFTGKNRLSSPSKSDSGFAPRMPIIADSHICNSIIGKNVTINSVNLLSGYKVGNNVLIENCGQIIGEKLSPYLISVINENGKRTISPIPGLTPFNYWFASHFYDRPNIHKALKRDTMNYYKNLASPSIADNSEILNCKVIKSMRSGENCTITNCSSIENVIIESNKDEKTTIENAIDIKDGIVSRGCYIGSGVVARKFAILPYCKLDSSARIFDSVIGANSTISCCEVISVLTGSFHEQHHNNSFLIAASLEGQSNVAAGATIGSNHNSRAADGEIHAARGFWPALSISLKHNSRFAPFTLIIKGFYPHEMNIPLPFSLVSRDVNEDRLQIYPAYSLQKNIYALERNSWKFRQRERQKIAEGSYLYNYLGPDTIISMINAIEWIENYSDSDDTLLIDEMICERSKDKVRLFYPGKAVQTYKEYINFWAVQTVVNSGTLKHKPPQSYSKRWQFCFGLPQTVKQIKTLIKEMENGQGSWSELQIEERRWVNRYKDETLELALWLLRTNKNHDINWKNRFTRAASLSKRIYTEARDKRIFDREDSFRKMVYSNDKEMQAILGEVEANPFLIYLKEKSDIFCKQIEMLLNTL